MQAAGDESGVVDEQMERTLPCFGESGDREFRSARSSCATRGLVVPVDVSIVSATAPPASVLRTARVTSAPAALSARAVSMPMPEEAPVTIARMPLRSTPWSTSSAVLAAVNRVEMSPSVVTDATVRSSANLFSLYAAVVSRPRVSRPSSTVADTPRRDAVLDSALVTFARFGYRKTSMEEVARAAHISRPGLYFLFASKDDLFRAAVTRSLEADIAAVERVLAVTDRPLPERLLDSFDRWAGRYIGPLTRDVTSVIEDNPDLLGTIVESTPRRFEESITAAIAAEHERAQSQRVAHTLISTSIGIKHQVDTRDAYLQRLDVAIDLLLR